MNVLYTAVEVVDDSCRGRQLGVIFRTDYDKDFDRIRWNVLAWGC